MMFVSRQNTKNTRWPSTPHLAPAALRRVLASTKLPCFQQRSLFSWRCLLSSSSCKGCQQRQRTYDLQHRVRCGRSALDLDGQDACRQGSITPHWEAQHRCDPG